MGKRDDERIARLAKQNASKEVKPKADKAVRYDDTLRAKAAEEDQDTKQLFKDMKRREF